MGVVEASLCNSNKDLSRIKSHSDKIMRDVFDDKGIGVKTKGSIRIEFGYERVG